MAALDFQLEQTDQARLNQRQDFAEFAAEVAEHLEPYDRALLRLVHGRGASVADIAAIAEVPANRLHSRLGRLRKRLSRPESQLLWDLRTVIPPGTIEVVLDHFIGGDSVATIADRYEYPERWVATTISTFRGYAQKRIKAARRK